MSRIHDVLLLALALALSAAPAEARDALRTPMSAGVATGANLTLGDAGFNKLVYQVADGGLHHFAGDQVSLEDYTYLRWDSRAGTSTGKVGLVPAGTVTGSSQTGAALNVIGDLVVGQSGEPGNTQINGYAISKGPLFADGGVYLQDGTSLTTLASVRFGVVDAGRVNADEAKFGNVDAGTITAQSITVGVIDGGVSYTASAYTWDVDDDFTTATPQTLSANGNYTVNGRTLTKYNSSADSTAMAISSSGLVITPVSATDLNGTTRTLPHVCWQLSSVVAGFGARTPLLFMVRIDKTATNASANFDALKFWIGSKSGDTPANFVAAIFGYQGGGAELPGWMWYPTSNYASVGNIAPYTAHDVMVLEMPDGYASGRAIVYSGQWASGWPTSASWWPVAAIHISAGTHYVASQPEACIGGQRSGSVTAFQGVVRQARIGHKPLVFQ